MTSKRLRNWPAALLLPVFVVAVTGQALGQAAQPPPDQNPVPGATPPIAPKIQETPLPPAVQLPGPPAMPPDLPNRPLTAEEAAQIALQHQPNVTVARAGITQARGVIQQVRSGLGPQLGVGAGYTYTQTIGTGTSGGGGGGGTVGTSGGGSVVTVSGYQASANVRQLVFDFNHTRDLVRQAQAQERAAGANLTRVQSDLVLQVKQAFYTFVQNNRLVSADETNVRNQQAHLALAQARLRAGVGLPLDVVRAETAVADAVQTLQVARNNASTSEVALATLMGIDPRTPIVPADTSEPAAPSNDVTAMVNQALGQRPDVLQAQFNVQAAQAGLSAARTTNAPSLAANLGLATRGQNFPPDNGSWSIGATIQWTPFDSGLTAGRVEQARGILVAAQANLANTQLAVTSDVSTAFLNLRTAEQRVTTADAEVANAQESVRLAEGRYRAGVGIFLDVLDAQAALLTAQTNRVNAQSAVDQARAALRRAIGLPW